MVLPTYFIHLSSTSLNILYCSSCHIFWLKWKKCHESFGYIYVSRTLHWGSLWCCIFFSILFHILFFSIYFISWRLITLQYCSGFCHTLTWISHGFTCVPHPDSPSHLPFHPIPLGLPSAPGPSTCLMHPTWAGDLFHYR